MKEVGNKLKLLRGELSLEDAAKRAKLTTVILPKRNKKDLDEIPKHILKGIHLVFADTMDDVMKVALRQGSKPARPTGKPSQQHPQSKKQALRTKAKPAARWLPVHAISTTTPPLAFYWRNA